MVYATITYQDKHKPSRFQELTLAVDAGYGLTAEIAHPVLELCLFYAECPLIADARGDIWFIPRPLLLGLRTWDSADAT